MWDRYQNFAFATVREGGLWLPFFYPLADITVRGAENDAKQRNALAFVLRQGDNGVVWNILSFWRDAG